MRRIDSSERRPGQIFNIVPHTFLRGFKKNAHGIHVYVSQLIAASLIKRIKDMSYYAAIKKVGHQTPGNTLNNSNICCHSSQFTIYFHVRISV